MAFILNVNPVLFCLDKHTQLKKCSTDLQILCRATIYTILNCYARRMNIIIILYKVFNMRDSLGMF